MAVFRGAHVHHSIKHLLADLGIAHLQDSRLLLAHAGCPTVTAPRAFATDLRLAAFVLGRVQLRV